MKLLSKSKRLIIYILVTVFVLTSYSKCDHQQQVESSVESQRITEESLNECTNELSKAYEIMMKQRDALIQLQLQLSLCKSEKRRV